MVADSAFAALHPRYWPLLMQFDAPCFDHAPNIALARDRPQIWRIDFLNGYPQKCLTIATKTVGAL